MQLESNNSLKMVSICATTPQGKGFEINYDYYNTKKTGDLKMLMNGGRHSVRMELMSWKKVTLKRSY